MTQKITNINVIKALDYILLNLENELCVEQIASHCHSSKYHFNRLFKAQTGESIYAFVKRMRVEKSAFRLGLEREQSITEIGLDYGYSASNFSSTFSKHLSLSPAKFRSLKYQNRFDITSPYDDLEINYQSYDYYDRQITINHLKDIHVVFHRYIGNYRDLQTLWPEFIEQYQYLRTENTRYVEVSQNDPNVTDIERCLFDLCMTIDEPLADEIPPLENVRVIAGGRVATYYFKGPAREINQTYKGLTNIWFPQCPYEPTGQPGLDFYRSYCAVTGQCEIDIHIPIK
jgi:AraC family transcriptional regulator